MTILSKTTAVVVTFNRSGKLMKVLDALKAQTLPPDEVLVVDNASTDDTEALVAGRAADMPSLRYLRLPQNIGGAGGFHEGMKAAYAQGANYFWISDDDAYPEPDALAKLLDALGTFEVQTGWRPGFACSRVEWIDQTLCEMNTPHPVWDWPRFVAPGQPWALVDSCSFVSCLVPRWAVKAHGLPIKEYFIWFDDAEYTRRLARSYPGIFVPESRVIHDTPDNKGVNYSLVTEKNIWKFKYGARNEASYHVRERGLVGFVAFANRVRTELVQGHVPAPLRRQIYGALLRGWRFKPAIEKVG